VNLGGESESATTVRFGPDAAARLVAVGGSIILLVAFTVVTMLQEWLCGVATMVLVLGAWYVVRVMTSNYIELTPNYLRTRTPFRSLEASWNSVARVSRGTFLRVYSTQGDWFKIPAYSESVFTVIAIRHFGLFKSHAKLDQQLNLFQSEFSGQLSVGYKFEKKWTWPSWRYVAIGIFLAITAQIIRIFH
jgi:hypothetical protein